MAVLSLPQSSVFTAFRLASWNIYLGLGALGSDKYLAMERHLARIQADIVALTELAQSDAELIRDNLAPDNGYEFMAYQDFATANTQGVLSKYPITKIEYIISTPPADEFARPPLYCEFDMGTKKVLGIYVVHAETWCITGPCTNGILPRTEWNRAVEWIRIRSDYENRRRANPELEIIVCGDWNDSPDKPQTAEITVLRIGGTNIEVRASFIAPDLTDVRLVTKRGTYNFNYGWQVFVSAGVLKFGYTTGGTNATAASVGTYVLTPGVAYDIMVQYDGTNVMFWVNGVLVESVPTTASVYVSSAPIKIGAVNDPASTHSKVSIWDVSVGTIFNPVGAWHNTTWQDLLGVANGTVN